MSPVCFVTHVPGPYLRGVAPLRSRLGYPCSRPHITPLEQLELIPASSDIAGAATKRTFELRAGNRITDFRIGLAGESACPTFQECYRGECPAFTRRDFTKFAVSIGASAAWGQTGRKAVPHTVGRNIAPRIGKASLPPIPTAPACCSGLVTHLTPINELTRRGRRRRRFSKSGSHRGSPRF